ncbi:MAG: anhydro-N-acetylmuramic acid kinase [Flavobacteriales bacterium]
MEKENCIGVMSGSSLDGLDIASVELSSKKRNKWSFRLLESKKIPFPQQIHRMLLNPGTLSSEDLAHLDREFGRFIGSSVRDHFTLEGSAAPTLIASHGHTLLHRPKRALTFQIGHGGTIAAKTGIPVVSDLRTMDVEYGGQGAPLAAIGDRLLFGDHDQCLNLGGFANLSYETKGEHKAFDICPVNTALNRVSRELGEAFDKNGQMAREGQLDQDMLSALEGLPFYRSGNYRSLGSEWLQEHFIPLIDQRLPEKDRLRTLLEHMAMRIGEKLKNTPGQETLVTGGGAYNWFLLERIQVHAPEQKLILPQDAIIEFKEAVIFALLGLLRWKSMPNSLSGATGADREVINGAVHLPTPSP